MANRINLQIINKDVSSNDLEIHIPVILFRKKAQECTSWIQILFGNSFLNPTSNGRR